MVKCHLGRGNSAEAMAKNPNRQIWENATPLEVAWRLFAHPAKSGRLAKMPGGIETLAGCVEAPTALTDFFKAGLDALAATSRRGTLILEMRGELLDELSNANLSALGYRELPSVSSAPVAIASEFFDSAKVHWDRNEAEAFGKRYNRVRIYDPYELPKTAKPKIGRIGSAEPVIAAIEQLIDLNPDFCDLPRKLACDQIRESLGIREISGNGLSNQNLSKYILQKCSNRQIDT
jgi:hypothetical protein